jgi:hypothetical protein
MTYATAASINLVRSLAGGRLPYGAALCYLVAAQDTTYSCCADCAEDADAEGLPLVGFYQPAQDTHCERCERFIPGGEL